MAMTKAIVERVERISKYFIDNRSTVRATAEAFKISKTTVHVDLTERLPLLDVQMSLVVRYILFDNFCDKHNRGGNAMKRRYINGRHDREISKG